MPGAFDDLLRDFSGSPGNLTPEQLGQIRGSGLDGFSTYWDTTTGGYNTGGDAGTWVAGPGRQLIYGPQTGSTWGTQRNHVWDDKGEYLGTSSGDGNSLAAAKFIASSVAAGYGTNYLNGLETAAAGSQYGGAAAEILGADATGYTAGMGATGAGGAGATFTANDIAMMSANGMTDAQIAATVGANNASALGLAGPGTGVTFADTVALANTQGPATGLQNTPSTVQPGPDVTNVPNTPVNNLGTTPPTTTVPTTAPPASGWDKLIAGLKEAKLVGLGTDQIIALGLAAGLKRDVKPGEMDPALVTALENYNKIAGDANDRAQANDDYWKSTFAPKLLDQMNQQMADGRRLTDFNMGQAQKYADYQWNTIVPQQRKFFDYGNKLLGEDTSANVERQVGLAGATARQANDSYISAAMNNLARMGVNPNSGVYASQARQFAQTGALAEAGERNRARQMALAAAKAEKLNVAGVMAGMGGNLSAASSGFSGQAANSSGLGMNGVQGAQQGWANNNAGWNATMGLGMNANAGIAGIGNTMFGAANQANRDNALGYNQLAGTLLAYGLNGIGRKG